MAFATAQARITAVEQAGNALGQLRTVHAFGVSLRDALTLYQAGTDATFNAAFNSLFTPADRAELADMIADLTTLADMIADLTTLVADWETNHAAALGLA